MLGRDIRDNFFKIKHKVYCGFLRRINHTLAVDGPPTTDETLVALINANLWDLTHLARWITLYEAQNLVILLGYFLFVVVMSDFYDVEGEILIENFLFLHDLIFYVRISIILFVDI